MSQDSQKTMLCAGMTGNDTSATSEAFGLLFSEVLKDIGEEMSDPILPVGVAVTFPNGSYITSIAKLTMSTRQTRSKSRGRAIRQPERPPSRVRNDAYFSDPDYGQPAPEPKTASTPSPSWGMFSDKRIAIQSYEMPDGIPSVSLMRSDGRRYYMSSACGPASYSATGKFQDRVTRPNASRAKAMAHPDLDASRRSASRPKRVEVSTRLDGDEERLRASSTWRKKRPDTPTSARATTFDISPKNSFSHSLETFVPRSGFVWLVLIFLGILLGLSSPPETSPVQFAYKEVCSRFGNPTNWNCNGNFNFTIDSVVSHCHNAADTIYDKFHMADAKTTVEDLVHSCQNTIDYGKDRLENMFEGTEKATAVFKRSLCALPGAEQWDDCVKTSASKLSEPSVMIASAFSSPFTVSRPSNKPSDPSEKIANPPSNAIGRAEHVANNVVASLASQAKSHASSALSSVSSAYLPFFSGSRGSDHTPKFMETGSTSPRSSLSAGIEEVSKINDLELKYNLAVAKARIKMLQQNDSSIIAHTTYTKRYLNSLLSTAWELQKEIDHFSICMIRTSENAIYELSKTISYESWTETWLGFSWSSWTVTPADKAFQALSNPPRECQTFLVRMHQKVLGALQTREALLKEIDRVIDLSYHHDFAKKSPWHIPVPLLWARTLEPFPNLLALPAIRWNPWYWFRDEAYWYRVRTQAEYEKGLRLHRLRLTLRQLREATESFDEIKNLLERGIVNLLNAHKDLETHRQEVVTDPVFGVPFLKGKIQAVKEDLAVAIKFRDERKHVKNCINAIAWERYNTGNDQHAVFDVKQMRV
ncbi:hypothetical protein QM012_002988 [Aureobasidium pullulans]|uniref:Uncharacterized protein n=1 Tax=Aureobasidium pullulans TaxID=5580 RepID=A0ABR0TAA4_AURPU